MKLENLVLDIDSETKEEILSVDKNLVKILMLHQAQGIKFMFDSCFESVERLNIDHGGGCILAHCMGLGMYTFYHAYELISFVDDLEL